MGQPAFDCPFSHSGDLGDIIFSLPALRARAREAGGPVTLVLFGSGKTTCWMTRQRMKLIAPLLERQRYIRAAKYSDTPRETPLNDFRGHCFKRNLADAHLAALGLPFGERETKWIEVEKKASAEVVICRTERYQTANFPWRKICEKYKGKMLFLGLREEHESFARNFDVVVPYQMTADLLEAAEIIAGSRLMIGNQTSLTAIAEGLKHNLILEACASLDTNTFTRIGKIHALDTAHFELPLLGPED